MHGKQRGKRAVPILGRYSRCCAREDAELGAGEEKEG